MADEDTQVLAENAVVEDNNQPVSPTDETTTSTEEETEVTAPSAEEPSEIQTEEERKPTRAEKKIREQHRTIKDLQSELQRTQPSQLPSTQTPQGFDIQQYVDDMGNLDINSVNEAINNQAVQSANAIAQLQVQNQVSQLKAELNLDSDIKTIPQEYPEFDDKSDQFIPELFAEVEKAYKSRAFRQIGVDAQGRPIRTLDSNVRLADIAASYAKAARSVANRQSADVKVSVARAADETSPRPGPQPPRVERKFEDLSKEEMEAKLGVVER